MMAACVAETFACPHVHSRKVKTVATDDRAANLATYADPALPLAPGLVEAIAGFIEAGS